MPERHDDAVSAARGRRPTTAVHNLLVGGSSLSGHTNEINALSRDPDRNSPPRFSRGNMWSNNLQRWDAGLGNEPRSGGRGDEGTNAGEMAARTRRPLPCQAIFRPPGPTPRLGVRQSTLTGDEQLLPFARFQSRVHTLAGRMARRLAMRIGHAWRCRAPVDWNRCLLVGIL